MKQSDSPVYNKDWLNFTLIIIEKISISLTGRNRNKRKESETSYNIRGSFCTKNLRVQGPEFMNKLVNTGYTESCLIIEET